ncbi:MAG: hypothetical protein PF542_05520 [Nanoarchaeota archaeon]|jgi:hypothetical protein|nr:hypothetical protein [Nanoarchaeota archaeon]
MKKSKVDYSVLEGVEIVGFSEWPKEVGNLVKEEEAKQAWKSYREGIDLLSKGFIGVIFGEDADYDLAKMKRAKKSELKKEDEKLEQVISEAYAQRFLVHYDNCSCKDRFCSLVMYLKGMVENSPLPEEPAITATDLLMDAVIIEAVLEGEPLDNFEQSIFDQCCEYNTDSPELKPGLSHICACTVEEPLIDGEKTKRVGSNNKHQ